MTKLQRPLRIPVSISDSWQGHKDRKPPSVEPGTDYRAPVGTPFYPILPGTVIGIHTAPTGASGRALMMSHGGGVYSRYLHDSDFHVGVGDYVNQSTSIGDTGASANGSNSGVGAHLHLTYWEGQGNHVPTPGSTPTQDFEAAYARQHATPADTDSVPFDPTQEDDDMPIVILQRNNSALTKSLYDTRSGKAVRAISKDENNAFRAAETGAVVYVTVSDAEYSERGGK